jgi:hypothetical protein
MSSTSNYMMKSFPRESVGEHSAIDKLRQVVNMAKVTAYLIDDSADFRDDDAAHADYLLTVAKESAELALSSLEDALKIINGEIK